MKVFSYFCVPLWADYKLNFIKQMQQYETVIILTPLLSEEIVKETLDKFRTYMTENGAEIVHEDNWGLKKLAYPIEKKSTGFFHLTQYKAPGDLINKLELQFKRDERVMRFLTIALDKHALAYNEKKRSGAFNKKTKKEEVK